MSHTKLTSKFQATIPQEIRSLLGLKAVDTIIFEVDKNNVIIIKKATALDIPYLKSISSTMEEWSSQN